MDTATINGITYHLVPVEGQSQHKAGEPFKGTVVNWLTYPEYGLADDPYWVQTIFGIDSFLSWEDKPRSINIRAVDDPHSYVWHPDGRSWLDRVMSKAYDWRTLHIAPKGYFDGDG